MTSLDNFEEFVKEKVEIYKCTHQQVSDELKSLFPGERGFSLRSVERFCCEKGIKKTTEIDDQQLDDVISEAVRQVPYRLLLRETYKPKGPTLAANTDRLMLKL